MTPKPSAELAAVEAAYRSADELSSRSALVALLTEMRSKVASWRRAAFTLAKHRRAERARAAAAEKRVAELEQQLRVTPAAAVREALEATRVAAQVAARQLRDGLPRGGRARISIALRAIVAMADDALAGAEAGERRVFEGYARQRESDDHYWTLDNAPGGDAPRILSDDSTWFDGLEGKRVSLIVEVLPDPKEAQ